jgi:3-oxoacyl-[acyl-carrier protein] reductase
MGLEYNKKNIIIFGGSNGVGLELAKKLLDQGAKILIICKSKKNIKKAHLVLGKEKDYKIIINDCYKFNNKIIHTSCKHFLTSKVDHLVSFLGTGKVEFGNSKSLKDWKNVFDKNFFVNVNIVNEFLKYFKKKDFSSSIILTGAIAGIERLRAPMTYSIAKTALIVYANHLSENLLKKKIRVFSVSPGNIFFKGGRWEQIKKKNKKRVSKFLEENVGMQRFGIPEEIALIYYNLMNPFNKFMTGNNIIVDGLQAKKIL